MKSPIGADNPPAKDFLCNHGCKGHKNNNNITSCSVWCREPWRSCRNHPEPLRQQQQVLTTGGEQCLEPRGDKRNQQEIQTDTPSLPGILEGWKEKHRQICKILLLQCILSIKCGSTVVFLQSLFHLLYLIGLTFTQIDG